MGGERPLDTLEPLADDFRFQEGRSAEPPRKYSVPTFTDPPPVSGQPTQGPAPVYSTYCVSPMASVSGGMCHGPSSARRCCARP